MIWSAGKGFTAPSRVLVAKSKKILGQMNASIVASSWSNQDCQLTVDRGMALHRRITYTKLMRL